MMLDLDARQNERVPWKDVERDLTAPAHSCGLVSTTAAGLYSSLSLSNTTRDDTLRSDNDNSHGRHAQI